VWIVALTAHITARIVRAWARLSHYDERVTGGVTQASSDLIDALRRARLLISEPNADQPAMITGATVPHSKEPWNIHVAQTVYGISVAARRLEAVTRMQVSGSVLERGGADACTDSAIEALSALSAAVPSKDAQEIDRALSGWTASVLRLKDIDERVIWLPIRTQTKCPNDGARLEYGTCPECGWRAHPPKCPYCQTMHLRRADRAFVVMCFYPGCEDRDGTSPPFARLDISDVTGRAILAWADGLVEGG